MFHHSANGIDFYDRFIEDALAAVKSGVATFEQWWWVRSQWSRATFGPVYRRGPEGPIKHMQKELEKEIFPLLEKMKETPRLVEVQERDPIVCTVNAVNPEYTKLREQLLEELVDVIFLATDAAERTGFSITDLRLALCEKMDKNHNRKWGKASDTEAVEHIREEGIVLPWFRFVGIFPGSDELRWV